ncbi:MAG TPA: class I SAM-dependent methyltransferase [Anaerolineaceae bacterium]|nr:class I SAM-dependent methyltransferase [Anaerolineaceae bacterium]
MNAELVSRLIDLNHLFYQTFAGPFAATRQRIQPGVQSIMNRMLNGVNPPAAILDLGCGNGELARRLMRRGYRGFFHGLDFSEGLLDEARRSLEGTAVERARFDLANLAEPGWDSVLGPLSFDAAVSFAVLHHLPGDDLRRSFVQSVARHVSPGGVF